MASDLLIALSPLGGVALGFVGTGFTNHLANRRAERDRARALFAQLVAGLSSFQVTVDDFHERRTSKRAMLMVLGQVALGLVAGQWEGGKTKALRAGAEEIRRVREWDQSEGDRLLRRLEAANAQLHPALFLLAMMSPALADATQPVGVALTEYAAARSDGQRRAAADSIKAAVDGLGLAVRGFTSRHWWQRAPRTVRPRAKAPAAS